MTTGNKSVRASALAVFSVGGGLLVGCGGGSTEGGTGTESDTSTGEATGSTTGSTTATGGVSSGTTGGTTTSATEGTSGTGDASTSSGSGSATTGSSGDNLTPQGDPCRGDAECVSGSCSDGVCCNSPCTDSCDVCRWDIGASEDGLCTPAPFTSPASDACAPQTCDGSGTDCVDLCVGEAAMPVRRPVDFVFVVDNSGSMAEEVQGLENNINVNLHQVLLASQVDAQFIMVTDHGPTSLQVCVPPPLSGTANCSGAPGELPSQFAHYDVNVQSHDGLCILLDTLFGSNAGGEPDEWGIHPDGWNPVLRPEALKVFVALSDDGTSCTWNSNTYNDGNADAAGETMALDWDADLLAASPGQFGTDADRNYVFHAVVGLAPINPISPTQPWLSADPVTTQECTPGAVDPGTGYQWLAKETGGLRFPICDPGVYDSYFNMLAADTVDRAIMECQYDVPTPAGETVDLGNLRLVHTPTVGSPVTFTPVADLAACGASTESFYVDSGVMHLCPDTCTPVAADETGTIQVEAMCE